MFRRLTDNELQEHEAELSAEGYTIIPGLLDNAGVDGVHEALSGFHERQDYGDNDFTGFRTKRVFNLFGRTRALDPLLLNRDVVQIVRSVLGPEAQLSIASTMEIHGEETAQALHRDDAYFPVNPHPPLVINTMWALTDFSRQMGLPGWSRVPT